MMGYKIIYGLDGSVRRAKSHRRKILRWLSSAVFVVFLAVFVWLNREIVRQVFYVLEMMTQQLQRGSSVMDVFDNFSLMISGG